MIIILYLWRIKMTILNIFLTKEEIHTTSISLNHNSISFNSIWQTTQLVATLVPSGSVDTVSWSSSNISVATVSYKWLVTCVGDWNCTITATTSNWLSTTCSVDVSTALFDFGDWSNSIWSVFSWWTGWTVTKTSTYVSFYNSGGYAQDYLSQYLIDWSKDFLFEMRANIPNTYVGYHSCGLVDSTNTRGVFFWTSWESNRRNKIFCCTPSDWNGWETNPWTANYFIRKQGTTLTMGWWGVTKRTENNFTSDTGYYLFSQVYRDTLTIYTAKLTYL